MDRRRFLRWLGGTAAGVAIAPTLDLERLLWVPGEKTIFLPPAVVPVTLDHFLKVGDIFTIAGKYDVNPLGDHGYLRHFVVTAVVDSRVHGRLGRAARRIRAGMAA